jgi:hypothetical protein
MQRTKPVTISMNKDLFRKMKELDSQFGVTMSRQVNIAWNKHYGKLIKRGRV